MYPVYSNVNSHPHLKNQTPSPHFYNPNWESFPSQMKENQVNSPQMHEYWPHNYAYPTPVSCQDCCSHGHHHSYYNYRPPCPHFLSPPPYGYGHYQGGYPAAYPPPFPYVPPPPHYPMGSPNGFHCCECPNHHSHVKSTNNVKIEEHEPDVETSKAESLVTTPARVNYSPDSPYPLMWVPPEYMKYKEGPKSDGESDTDDKRVTPYVESRKPNQSRSQAVEQDPNARYQWFPLDMDSIKRLREGEKVMKPHDLEKKSGDEKQALDVEKKDQNKHFSYPIIRLPYDGLKDHFGGKAPAEAQEEWKNNSKRPVEEHPSVLKLVKHPDEEIVKERASEGDHANGIGTRGSHKTGKVRIIPVKQLDDSASKSLKHEQESIVKENLKTDGKITKNATDMKPSSLTKKSKLPPICLRVDPPRKKNGKDGSRLPTPPREKKHQEDSKGKMKDWELRACQEEMKVKEVLEKDPNENNVNEENGACTREYQPKTEAKVVQDADNSKSDAIKSEGDDMHAIEPQGVKGNEDGVNGAPLRKLMSETEATVIIQSAYRGFAVRRWELLKKLRLIANVREEVTKIKGQIEKLESCITVDHKVKVAVGETIMNLLLKLDSVQRLHPSVREVRRSVAKELVMLQEKLDCIVSQNSIPGNPDSSTNKEVGEHSTTFGSNEESAEPLETEVAEIAEQGTEAFSADQNVEPQKDAFITRNEKVQEVNEEEPGRDPHNEEVMSPVGSPVFCMEMKEKELDRTTKVPDDSSMESNSWTQDLATKSVQETLVDQVEDDICRMEWECDLAAAKVTCSIDPDVTELAQSHRVEKNGIPAESHGELIMKDLGVQESATSNDVKYMEVPNLVEQDGRLYESVAKGEVPVFEEAGSEKCGDPVSAFEVKKMEEEREPENDEVPSEIEGARVWNNEQNVDDLLAAEQVHHKITESEKAEGVGVTDSENTHDSKCMEIPIIEVEKMVINEDRETEVEERSEEATNGSLDNLQTISSEHVTELPISEGVMDEGNTESSTFIRDAQQYKDVYDASSASNGEQIERRIIEENEKLRQMVEKLLASGKEQQEVISSLAAKVKDLEKKMPKRSKIRSVKRPGIVVSRGKSLVAR